MVYGMVCPTFSLGYGIWIWNFNEKLGSMSGKRHFLIKWLPGSCGKKVYPLKSVEFDQESDGNVFRTSWASFEKKIFSFFEKILKIFLRLEKKFFSQLVQLVPKTLPFDSSSNSILFRGQDFWNRTAGSHFMADHFHKILKTFISRQIMILESWDHAQSITNLM